MALKNPLQVRSNASRRGWDARKRMQRARADALAAELRDRLAPATDITNLARVRAAILQGLDERGLGLPPGDSATAPQQKREAPAAPVDAPVPRCFTRDVP